MMPSLQEGEKNYRRKADRIAGIQNELTDTFVSLLIWYTRDYNLASLRVLRLPADLTSCDCWGAWTPPKPGTIQRPGLSHRHPLKTLKPAISIVRIAHEHQDPAEISHCPEASGIPFRWDAFAVEGWFSLYGETVSWMLTTTTAPSVCLGKATLLALVAQQEEILSSSIYSLFLRYASLTSFDSTTPKSWRYTDSIT